MTTPPLQHEIGTSSPFISRIRLRRYKSIAACDVALGPLTVLVGPNGSGKSNFLDALAFIAEALDVSVEHALRARGGVAALRHRPAAVSDPVEIVLELRLTAQSRGLYSVALAELESGGFVVMREACEIFSGQIPEPEFYFEVEAGELVARSAEKGPAVMRDRLYLVHASGEPEFRPIFDALVHMAFYNLDPDRIPRLTEPGRDDTLAPDAANLVSVMRRLQTQRPETRERIETYLRAILPTLRTVEVQTLGAFETLEFVLETGGRLERFPITSISDGTLRALAVLVSALQPATEPQRPFTLIGFEEPEKAIHPGATGALADVFREASETVQVMVTTHSPDFLDHDSITAQDVVAVIADEGVTQLGRLDTISLQALRDQLCTPGELLRMNQLRPEPMEVGCTTTPEAERSREC